jgi:hypothetical protein
LQLAPEFLPVLGAKAGMPINLLNQQDVTRVTISEQPEQLGSPQ